MEIYYKSQREYGNLNMCTAVCYNLAMRYLVASHDGIFSHESIDDIMKQSAEFYQNAQKPNKTGLLGVFDIVKSVKLPPGIVGKDFAGTLLGSSGDGELDEVEGLFVMPLADTLQLLRETTVPAAFIATFSEHSIVFLAEAGGRVMLFDPLPASLVDVSLRDACSAIGGAEVMYSGVLFGHAAE